MYLCFKKCQNNNTSKQFVPVINDNDKENGSWFREQNVFAKNTCIGNTFKENWNYVYFT